MYLVNRLETTCRKSLIPFNAIWGLCWYNFLALGGMLEERWGVPYLCGIIYIYIFIFATQFCGNYLINHKP